MINLYRVKRFCAINLLVFCLSLMIVPIASATELIQDDHLSASDLSINQSLNQMNFNFINSKEMEMVSAEIASQKDEAEAKVMKRIIEEAQMENSNKYSTPSLRTTYDITGRDSSHGGWGVGNCDSYWETFNDINRNGSIAEIAGSKWAKGWGWTYFTPSSSKNYTIGVNYNLTGRVFGGNLNIKLKVTDVNNGSTNEQTCFSATSGYFDNVSKSNSKTFYLTSGRRYAITWEADTDATAAASAVMSDFLTQEFDGTQRNLTFNYFSIN